MRHERNHRWAGARALVMALLLVGATASTAWAQIDKSTMTVYGFAMLDFGQNFKTINPKWYDTMRVTRLPKFDKEFGEDNSTFASVRQTRFGVKTSTPTALGDLTTIFEFELFGTGSEEGKTTLRLRHAYGQLGKFGAGQTWSVFMDPDVFPNSVEYWGPTGMVFYRNIQFRYIAISNERHSLWLALEQPGASGDGGVLTDRVEIDNIQGRNPAPDFTAAYTHFLKKWGYVRIATVVRRMAWDDTLADQFELSGHATGWGVNLSSNLKPTTKDVIRIQVMFGEGVQNYMNDSPIDVGAASNLNNAVTPVVGKALPILATVFFLDHTFNDKWSATAGYSHQEIENSDLQSPDAFRKGHYALGNIMFYPTKNVMMGGEFQWGQRQNFSDGWKYDGYKVQFSFKYNFSRTFGIGG